MTRLAQIPQVPFTWSDARRLGLSRRHVDELVRTRQLRRILRNVSVDARVPDSLELRAQAAGLVLTSQGVFVDRTAAWLHGVDILDYRELEILPPLECVVLRDRSRIERPECVGGERDLAPYDVMRLSGVRVTTPLRTALDLGCLLPGCRRRSRSTGCSITVSRSSGSICPIPSTGSPSSTTVSSGTTALRSSGTRTVPGGPGWSSTGGPSSWSARVTSRPSG